MFLLILLKGLDSLEEKSINEPSLYFFCKDNILCFTGAMNNEGCWASSGVSGAESHHMQSRKGEGWEEKPEEMPASGLKQQRTLSCFSLCFEKKIILFPDVSV